jgi:purine-binding chemotaxis protein CheW
MAERTATKATDGKQKSGKYLTFGLADEEFGLEILKVREIIGMMDITAVPLAPPFIKGILNLRGRVIPVMDLRSRFGMPGCERTAATCIIVVYVGSTGLAAGGQFEVGIIVDRVSEVMDIAASDIEETPSFGVAVDTRFILGIGKTGGKVTILLDIDKTLTDQDIESLSVATA